jgi:anthranilate synthase component 1
VKAGDYNFGPDDLARLQSAGRAVPLCREISADLMTPVGAALRLRRGAVGAFLLESVEGGESVARYSFLGRNPVGWVRASVSREAAAPLGLLRRALRPFRPLRLPDLPPFLGGAVGFAAYDLVRGLERLPRGAPDDLGLPDLVCGLYDTIVAFDHPRQRLQIVTLIPPAGGRPGGRSMRDAWRRAAARLAEVERDLRRPLPKPRLRRRAKGSWTATTRPKTYAAAVRRAQAHIEAGDIFQVVLSQRFDRPAAAPPLGIYRALRRINPSPYMFHLDLDGVVLTGASPEMLVRVDEGRVRTRPIAGTRRRGRDEEDDRRLERALRADPKEKAEHVMLVDLGRNDLGRVCRAGSVEVTRFMEIERYSHVMHLVSEVSGRLRPGLDGIDAFASCFPAGTVSGAPKVRAMQIIDDLEPLRRGAYAGAVFWADGGGRLDSCLTIRTVLERRGVVHVQAGAGIVADSRPAREHRECLAKAGALMEAVERAEAAS